MAKILIIDDDSEIRVMLRQLFEREGFEVMDASDGKEGIRLYRETSADLIISDLIMPGKEGLETIRELKKEYPNVKIIAMSGGGRANPDGYLDLAKKLGAIQTFEKPIRKEELLKSIHNLI